VLIFFDEAAEKKRNKRLLGPLEQVLVIGAYCYDLRSRQWDIRARTTAVGGTGGYGLPITDVYKQMKQMAHGDGTSSGALLTKYKYGMWAAKRATQERASGPKERALERSVI
jgi:hypothetical protein